LGVVIQSELDIYHSSDMW